MGDYCSYNKDRPFEDSKFRKYFNFVFDTTELCIELAFTMDHFHLSNCFRATKKTVKNTIFFANKTEI